MRFPKTALIILASVMFAAVCSRAMSQVTRQTAPGQTQQAVNSGQLVTPALQAIDDKSPNGQHPSATKNQAPLRLLT